MAAVGLGRQSHLLTNFVSYWWLFFNPFLGSVTSIFACFHFSEAHLKRSTCFCLFVICFYLTGPVLSCSTPVSLNVAGKLLAAASRIQFPDRELNSGPLYWSVKSQPMDHYGNSDVFSFVCLFFAFCFNMTLTEEGDFTLVKNYKPWAWFGMTKSSDYSLW